MTPELFSDAMNEIGAKYVEEALTYKRPAQRSFWSKLAKRAAMVALVALLALSGFAAASPAARAAMIHWVETWTGSQVSYEYAGDAPTGELPFVKNRFYKGSSKNRGSGIGLAVCDEIVSRHGGKLSIANAEGGGCIAEISLPLSEN